ncbi:hypothetical protein DYY66_2347 [Candidatus Nitrosotalea sp. FS]|nr:hypothetical protein [Candidatus Nitrosotalea sp. FS]
MLTNLSCSSAVVVAKSFRSKGGTSLYAENLGSSSWMTLNGATFFVFPALKNVVMISRISSLSLKIGYCLRQI